MPFDDFFTAKHSGKLPAESPAREKWHRLSKALPAPRRPDTCQNCGRNDKQARLQIWRECDDRDQPQNIFVVLCEECTATLIKPHPRLYHDVPENKPIPGVMAHLCVGCKHRDGLDCKHPDLKANGGPGLLIVAPQPTRGFMDGTRGGKRTGWMFEYWPGPATECKGRVPTC